MKVMNPMFIVLPKMKNILFQRICTRSIYSGNQEKSILNVLHTGVFYLLGDKQVFQFK